MNASGVRGMSPMNPMRRCPSADQVLRRDPTAKDIVGYDARQRPMVGIHENRRQSRALDPLELQRVRARATR